MGCGGSKEQDPKEIKKIRTEFAKTKIAKFDDFFEKASGLLENAEKIRAGLDDAKDDGKELTDCYKLKNYEYADVVKVLFWSLSANAKGNIKNTKVRVSEEAPFVHLDYFDGLLIETREVADSFEAFLGAVTGAPEAIKGIIENLTDMLSQSAELSKSGPDDIKNSGLNVIDQAKATANLAKNCAKLAKEVPKVQQLPPLIQDAVKDLKVLVPQFKQIYNNCDEIGAKAYQEFTIAKPKDIFHKFHTGERKTAEELEAEQKEEEKKHGKKHKKKDDKKKDDKKHGKKDDKKDDKKDHDKKDDKKDHDNKDEKKEEHHKK